MTATERIDGQAGRAGSPGKHAKPGLRLILAAGLCVGTLFASPVWSQTIGVPPLAALHLALHLNGQQETAWKAYRDEASAPIRTQERRRAAAQLFPSLSAPQRMDLVEAEMRQELLDLQNQSRALKAFYATLSPEQQRIFNARTLPPPDGRQPGQ